MRVFSRLLNLVLEAVGYRRLSRDAVELWVPEGVELVREVPVERVKEVLRGDPEIARFITGFRETDKWLIIEHSASRRRAWELRDRIIKALKGAGIDVPVGFGYERGTFAIPKAYEVKPVKVGLAWSSSGVEVNVTGDVYPYRRELAQLGLKCTPGLCTTTITDKERLKGVLQGIIDVLKRARAVFQIPKDLDYEIEMCWSHYIEAKARREELLRRELEEKMRRAEELRRKIEEEERRRRELIEGIAKKVEGLLEGIGSTRALEFIRSREWSFAEATFDEAPYACFKPVKFLGSDEWSAINSEMKRVGGRWVRGYGWCFNLAKL